MRLTLSMVTLLVLQGCSSMAVSFNQTSGSGDYNPLTVSISWSWKVQIRQTIVFQTGRDFDLQGHGCELQHHKVQTVFDWKGIHVDELISVFSWTNSDTTQFPHRTIGNPDWLTPQSNEKSDPPKPRVVGSIPASRTNFFKSDYLFQN